MIREFIVKIEMPPGIPANYVQALIKDAVRCEIIQRESAINYKKIKVSSIPQYRPRKVVRK